MKKTSVTFFRNFLFIYLFFNILHVCNSKLLTATKKYEEITHPHPGITTLILDSVEYFPDCFSGPILYYQSNLFTVSSQVSQIHRQRFITYPKVIRQTQ